MTAVNIIVIVLALIFFAALFLALVSISPKESLDDQAEAIRRNAEEREQKKRLREMKRQRRRMYEINHFTQFLLYL